MSVTSTLNVTVTLTDTDGNTTSASTSSTTSAADVITITSISVTPMDGPVGTPRLLDVAYTTSAGEPVTGVVTATSVPPGPIPTFTPVANPPAGHVQWTYTQ